MKRLWKGRRPSLLDGSENPSTEAIRERLASTSQQVSVTELHRQGLREVRVVDPSAIERVVSEVIHEVLERRSEALSRHEHRNVRERVQARLKRMGAAEIELPVVRAAPAPPAPSPPASSEDDDAFNALFHREEPEPDPPADPPTPRSPAEPDPEPVDDEALPLLPGNTPEQAREQGWRREHLAHRIEELNDELEWRHKEIEFELEQELVVGIPDDELEAFERSALQLFLPLVRNGDLREVAAFEEALIDAVRSSIERVRLQQRDELVADREQRIAHLEHWLRGVSELLGAYEQELADLETKAGRPSSAGPVDD